MPDSTPIVRQWRLLTALSSRRFGVAVRELAEEYGVSQKTVRRDLQLLRRIGLPLEEIEQDHGRKVWKISEPHTRPPLGFTLTEAIALYLGRRFLEPLAGTHFWEGATSAFAKIRAALGDSVLKYLDKMSAVMHHSFGGTADYSAKAEVLDALTIAIEDCNVTLLEYQSESSTEPVTREIHPYGWIYHRHSLYLVAWATAHQSVRTYKLDRVESVDMTNLRFPRPVDFQIAEHIAGAFGVYQGPPGEEVLVQVRFAAAVARYVQEKTWHASQQLHVQADGRLLAEFRLSTTEEIKHWLLSFGAQVEVLEPAALVAEFRQEIAALGKLYTRTAPRSPKPRRRPK